MSISVRIDKLQTTAYTIGLVILFYFIPVCTLAQDTDEESPVTRHFEGFYLGINTGIQNVFSGAIINELSVPEQSSRWVTEFFIAHRWQFLHDRVVFGLEVQVGLTDGNLTRSYGVFPQLDIDYANNNQAGLGYTLGYVAGNQQRLLIYSYIYQIRRTFDISLIDDGRILAWQRNSHTALRYGMGAEYNMGKSFSIRTALGSQSTDIDSRITIDHALEATLSFVYQF